MLAQSITTFRNAFKVGDIRKKILISLALIAVYRLGAFIPVPFINQQVLAEYMEQATRGSGLFGMVNMFTGGAFSNMTIFALGIMPYISAQIILQLLMIVWPRLEKISKEGEIGRRKINKFTRYGTIALTAFQAFGISIYLMNPDASGTSFKIANVSSALFMFTTIVAMTTGTAFIMWLGEQITEFGIGNGISLIIAVGIIAEYPGAITQFVLHLANPDAGLAKIWVPVVLGLLFLVSLGIVYTQEGARRIPIQHAKRVVGRRVMGGVGNVLPLKVNTAGVIPVIFASAILQLPGLLFAGVGSGGGGGFLAGVGEFFAFGSSYNVHAFLAWITGWEMGGFFNIFKAFNAYMLMEVLLISFFCFFYTAVTFNPLDVADNLKKSGAFVPGYRPGKPTAQYIDYVLTRITVIGTVFLVGVSILPMMLIIGYNMPGYLYQLVGGTGLIIVVGVVLQTVQQLEAQLMTYNYEGFQGRRRRRELGTGDKKQTVAQEATKNIVRRSAVRQSRRVPTRGADRPSSK